jgi:hypothetical protein
MQWLIRYFSEIELDKIVLWCYFIWYLTVGYFYFDPSPKIWLNSIGISAVIGTGLMLSVSTSNASERDFWQTFRLYLMPFCVSSFSALIKDRGFIVFISPNITENMVAILACLLALLFVAIVKSINSPPTLID